MADYRETVNSLAMNEQIVKLRQKIEIEQKLKQRYIVILNPNPVVIWYYHFFGFRRTINQRSQRSQRRESTFIANRAMKVKRKT